MTEGDRIASHKKETKLILRDNDTIHVVLEADMTLWEEKKRRRKKKTPGCIVSVQS